MVDDAQVLLAFGKPQAATDDLHVEHLRLGRPRQYDAAHVPIDAGCQRADIADHADFASIEALAIASRSSIEVKAST